MELGSSDYRVVVVCFNRCSTNVGEMPLLKRLVVFAFVRFTRVCAGWVVLKMEDSRERGEVLEVNSQPVTSFPFKIESKACDWTLSYINHTSIDIKLWTHEFKLQ